MGTLGISRVKYCNEDLKMMTAEELNYYDAKCETCKYNKIYKAGITYQVCGLYSNDCSTL